MTDLDFLSLEKHLGYTFKDKELLATALTHKTYAYEATTPVGFNERLEFLGDSVLNLVIAEQLYQSNTWFSEGELTRRRSMMVNNKLLAEKAKTYNLGQYLRLGRGEQKQQGEENNTNLANAFEAVIGAVYLDAGLKETRKFILRTIVQENLE